jgi:hypothetical protein
LRLSRLYRPVIFHDLVFAKRGCRGKDCQGQFRFSGGLDSCLIYIAILYSLFIKVIQQSNSFHNKIIKFQ